MGRKLFREIEPGESKETYLSYIKSICRIENGRRFYGSGLRVFARLKWNTYHPEDPVFRSDGYHIDHRDDNPMNDNISNYIKRTRSDHMSRHNKGRSLETTKKMREAGKGNKCASKPVLAAGVKYPSCTEAATSLKVSNSIITRRIQAKKPGYKYL